VWTQLLVLSLLELLLLLLLPRQRLVHLQAVNAGQ
jgi:hypothetical protein